MSCCVLACSMSAMDTVHLFLSLSPYLVSQYGGRKAGVAALPLPQFILFALDVSRLVCPCLSAWWLKLLRDVLLVVLLFLNLLLDLSPLATRQEPSIFQKSVRNSQLPIAIWDFGIYANLFVQDSGISYHCIHPTLGSNFL